MAVVQITPDKDTKIFNALPDNNFGGEADMTVGQDPPGWIKRGLVSWDLSTIPAGSIISSAYYKFKDLAGNNVNTNAYRVTETWAEMTVTWNTPTVGGPTISDLIANFIVPSGWNSVDITTAVQNWFSGAWANYGMKLMGVDESGGSYFMAVTKEGGADAQYLEVTYTPPSGPPVGSLAMMGCGV